MNETAVETTTKTNGHVTTKVRPYHGQVLVKKETPDEKTASGLIIPNPKNKLWATIVAIGKNVEDLAVGDRIMWKDTWKTTPGGPPVMSKVGFYVDEPNGIIAVHKSQIIALEPGNRTF